MPIPVTLAPDNTAITFQYSVYVRDEFKAASGNALRKVPNASLTLYCADGVTPRKIYSDSSFTLVNSTGSVTTNTEGVWTAYLDPAEGNAIVEYKGRKYSDQAIPVGPDSRESEYDLKKFSVDHGFNAGDLIVSRTYLDQRLEDFIPSAGGLSEAQVRQIFTDMIAQIPDSPLPAAPDLSPFARIRGDVANRDIAITNAIPSVGYEAVPFIGADGKIYLREATVSTAPNTPVTTPEAVDTITSLSDTHNHFVKAYINTNGSLVGATVTIRDLARAMEECAVQGDDVTFDKLFTWAESNFKRTSQSTAKYLYGSTYTVASTSVTSWTVDSGAMLTVFASIYRMWNFKGDDRYKDAASRIISDLVNYCVIEDEGRAYLAIDETQKAVGGKGHHTDPGTGGYVSMHEPGAVNPMHFNAAKTFTGSAIFDRLIAGWYDLVNKMIQTSVGSGVTSMPWDIVGYNTATHQVHKIVNGQQGWTVDRTSTFAASSWRVGLHLLMHKRLFSNTLGTNALNNFVAFIQKVWTRDAKVWDNYNNDNTVGSGATETSESALTAVLIVKDAGNTTLASAIRTAKVPAKATDANGSYFPQQVVGTTPSSSRSGDLRSWLTLSRDQDRYVDIAKLGPNPSVGTIYGTDGTGTSTPPVVVTPGTGNNSGGGTTAPVTGTRKLYADTQSLAAMYKQNNGGSWSTAKKQGWDYGTSRPSGFWISSGWGDSGMDYLRQYLIRCKAAGADATILIYDMPFRDVSGGYSSGGAATAQAYKNTYTTKIVPILNEFPDVKKWIVAEPDSAADLIHLRQVAGNDAANLRADLLKWMGLYATTNVTNLGGIYLDAGHPVWHPAGEMADILRTCGIENFTGFAVNTSNCWNFDLCVNWAQQIRAIIGTSKRFTIDCGRNGAPDGGTQQWANPPNRRFGRFPQCGNLGVDGLDLICDWKRPGESDGNSGDGSPNAGEFWPVYWWNDNVGYNVDNSLVSQSSGLCQRPPSPVAPNPSASGGQAG